MANPVKVLPILLLILIGGLGGTYLLDWGMPEYVVLKTANNNKYGKDYQAYFIDPSDETNIAWWDWSYKNRWLVDNSDSTQKTKIYEKFNESNIDSGYSKDGKSLNKVCKDSYDEKTTDVTNKTSKPNYEESIWRFCSIGGVKPLTLEEAKDQEFEKNSTSFGVTKKNVLISANEKNNKTNKWFWDLKDKEFYEGNNPKGAQEEEGSYFKAKYDDNKNRNLDKESVQKFCQSAYASNPATSKDKSKPQESEILKFCSLKGS